MHNLKFANYDRMQKLQNKAMRICLQRDNRYIVRKLHTYGGVN